MLLSTGEQISCSLCAMAIEAMGYPVISLTGWQAGVRTNSSYGNARIKRVEPERILAELDKKTHRDCHRLPGHQQVRRHHHPGPGRFGYLCRGAGGRLHADLCQIYTDVDGVYTADPRHVTGARKLDEITLRRDAGAGHAGCAGAPQPVGGDGEAVQCQSGGALQLFRQARDQSQGGREKHGKDRMSAV